MIRTVIIDDEEEGIENLRLLLETRCPDIQLAGTASSAAEGFRLIKSTEPELVFLDIEMPKESGFQLLERFPSFNFEVVFATAYDHYAIRAIKFSALDYLLKPIDADELEETVNKVRRKKAAGLQGFSGRIETLLSNIREDVRDKRLAISNSDGMTVVNIRDIIRCRADVNYTTIYLASGEKVVVAKTLKEYEDMLVHYDFFRVHNSSLVNLRHVKKFLKGDGGYVVMSDNSNVEVSGRRKNEFLLRLAELR